MKTFKLLLSLTIVIITLSCDFEIGDNIAGQHFPEDIIDLGDLGFIVLFYDTSPNLDGHFQRLTRELEYYNGTQTISRDS